MSTPATGYRGTQIFNNGVLADPIDIPNATYADYLQLMGGDVAMTLALLKELGLTPPGIPVPTIASPLNTTQSVIQEPIFQPAQPNVYQNYTSLFFKGTFGPFYASAINEVTTGLQPSLTLWMKGPDKWIKIIYAAGTGGTASVNGTIYPTSGYTYRLSFTNLIAGKSKINWYQGTAPIMGAPTITRTGSVFSITKHVNAPALTSLEWRKKNTSSIWQPYVGPFTKPSGSYTLEARALKTGYNDTNAISESIVI